MKIIDIIECGDKLRFVTDNKSRPEFVYKNNMFGDLDGFKNEIKKSIVFETKRKEKVETKTAKVKVKFDKEKADNLAYEKMIEDLRKRDEEILNARD